MVLFPQYRYEVFKKISPTSLSPVPIIISNFDSIEYAGGIETTKDVLSSKVFNSRNSSGSWVTYLGKKTRDENILGVDDEIKFYGYYGSVLPSNPDNALILAGRVNGYSYQPETERYAYTIKVVNRTEELLNTMVPYSTRANIGSANTSPTAIKQMIARLNKFNPNKNIVAGFTTEILPMTGSYGNIAAFNSTGGSFPTIDYNETWKPTYYNIEKLSSPEYTEDENAGEYICYIKYTPVLPDFRATYGSSVNELVWKAKNLVSSGSLIEGQDITNVKIDLSVKDVQNLLIVNAGTDRKGAGITTVAYNLESMGKYGVKTGYYTRSRRVFSEIHGEEIRYVQNTLGKVIDSDGMPAAGVGSYPLNMSFLGRNEFGSFEAGSVLTATSKTEWNNYLRDEARWKARVQAEKVLEKLGEPRYILNSDLIIGSNNIIAGDLYTFIVPSYGWEGNASNPSYILRLKDIQHSFTENGWSTSFRAEEDEKVISTYLNNPRSNVSFE